MRSTAPIRALEEWGIPSDMISKKDFGELDPDFSNETWEGKFKNRRADFILMPPDS